jgi:NarL family two-component system response regulator LiaR
MSERDRPINVLIVDDQPIFVDALRALLESEPGLCVIATAEDGEEALRLAESTDVDVALVDLTLPGIDGVETMRRLVDEQPELKVIAVSGRSEDVVERAAREAGASGFLLKGALHDEVAAAIVAAADDGRSFTEAQQSDHRASK